MRRTPLLAVLFFAVAAGLFLLWKLLDTPEARRDEATGAAQAERSDLAPTAPAGGESASALEVGDDAHGAAVDARSSAALVQDRTRTENFALDEARWVEGRVIFPAGTPADESVDVWMLPSTVKADPKSRTRVSSMSDAFNMIHLARTNERENEWAVRPLGADRTFRIPCPKSASTVNIVLDGRYVYLAEPAQVQFEGEVAPLVLEPVLGGWLVARCAVPAGAESDESLVGVPTMLSGFKLDSQSMRRGGGMVQRESEVGGDLSFDYRGLVPDLRYTLVVSPKKFAVATNGDLLIQAGRKTVVKVEFDRGARVLGRVKNERGEPVAGVSIEAQERRFNMAPNFGNSQRKTESAADGTFELGGLRAGKTHLYATLDGYVDGKSEELVLAAGDTTPGVEIEVSLGNRISGRVNWPDGKPAAKATISARHDGPAAAPGGRRGPGARRAPSTRSGETESTIADDKGEFTLTGLGDGPFTVQAGATKTPADPAAPVQARTSDVDRTVEAIQAIGALTPGGKRADGPLWSATVHDVAAGASGLEFVLREPNGLKGRIVDDIGAPVTAFTVTAMPSFGDDGPIVDRSPQFKLFNSADGSFLLPGIQDGKFSVSVQSDGYTQTGDPPVVVLPQTGAELLITLVRTGSAAGRVLDPTGRPVASAHVGTETPGAAGRFRFGNDALDAETDADGNFVLKSVPIGTVSFTASAEHWAKSEPLTVQILPEQETEGLVITLRAGGRLTGEIYNTRGEPGAGRSIQMFSMDAGDMRSMRADASGRFEADHLTPGSYQLIAEPGQKEREDLEQRMGDDADPTEIMSQLKMTSATIQDGVETHVVMGAPPKAPVKLSGTVTRAGEPAGSRMVTVIGEGGSMLESFKIGKVDAAGRYELTLDKPGPIVLIVSTQADAQPGSGIEFYETIPEVPEYRLDLALPLGAIRGRVRGPGGEPLAAIRVQLATDGALTSLSMMASSGPTSAETDARGNFEFTDLHPGTFAVAAGGSMGRRFQSEDSAHGRSVRGGLRVEADKVLDGIELVLRAPGKISGRVQDAAGAPVPGATVYVRDAAGELLHRFSGVTSDSSGRFTYEGVSPGKFTLCARTEKLASEESKPVSVHEGETTEVDLALEPGTSLRITVEDGANKAVRAQISVKNERDHEVAGMLAFDAFQAMFSEGLSSTERRVGPLPAGKYVVTATTRDGQTTKKSVTLKGQDERKVVLRLD